MKQALKSADLGSITAKEARRHLQESANINDPVSMLLEAKVLELEDRSLEATHFYERVANLTPSEGSALLQNERLDSRTLAQAESLSKADAWVQLARIQAKTGNQEASKANLVRAAFDYDSPIAFYLLAKYNSALSSPDYLPCMLKAASAGVPGAAHELGLYHLYQYFGWITPAPERQKAKWKIWWDTTTKFADLSAEKPGFFRTAAEWFAVAAEADYKASQVYLALLYHENSLQGSFVMPSISIIKRAPSTRVSDLKASQFLLDNLKTDGVWSSIAHRVRSKCVDNGEKNLEGSIRFAEGLMKRSTGTKIENGHEGFLHSINDLGP
ncbi:hypothetical protein MMC09_002596 [Bachmanniomyces sp. S44760]|nr:hypothetical protein [Bachmanniomyces sp. S44760]